MPLTPMTGRHEIRQAFEALRARMQQGAEPILCSVGWHGGGDTLTVYWRPVEKVWSHLSDSYADDRYWCCFSTDDPRGSSPGITCEINPPFKRVNRRLGGVFAWDDDGEAVLVHTGKVGGGRAGIGKAAFHAFFRDGEVATLEWPTGVAEPVFVVGRLNDPDLPGKIAHFIRVVERFKAEVANA